MYFCRARAEETASSICILGNCTRARLGLPRGRYPLKETEQMRVCPRGPSLRCFVEYFHISSTQSPIHRIMAENRSDSIDSCMVFIDVCTICLTTLQLSSAMRDTDICKRESKIIDEQFASFFFSRKRRIAELGMTFGICNEADLRGYRQKNIKHWDSRRYIFSGHVTCIVRKILQFL